MSECPYCHLKVDHVTIMNWVRAHSDQLPQPPLPQVRPLHIVEIDELYTFVERDEEILQALLDTTPQAVWYL